MPGGWDERKKEKEKEKDTEAHTEKKRQSTLIQNVGVIRYYVEFCHFEIFKACPKLWITTMAIWISLVISSLFSHTFSLYVSLSLSLHIHSFTRHFYDTGLLILIFFMMVWIKKKVKEGIRSRMKQQATLLLYFESICSKNFFSF